MKDYKYSINKKCRCTQKECPLFGNCVLCVQNHVEICVGALPLGKSGILRNRKATTYHLMNGKRRKQLESFGAYVQDQSIVIDGNIITSTSPATALDVAFTLLRMLTSPDNEKKVKTAMGFL